MGNCMGSHANKSTPPSTGNPNTEVSITTSQPTSSGTSKSSGRDSQFSVPSGYESSLSGQFLSIPNLRTFSLADLKVATKNFKSDTLLGEGGFGQVFKGWLEEKGPGKNGISTTTLIAVKKLKSESDQGFEEWQCEVNFLGTLSHPNLVKLLGYCWEEGELLLVYELMQKGSLENHLFGRGAAVQPLPWDLRLKIAIGAARGLAFLHTSEKQVIYRDFKASNILLDSLYNAKLSDFGLAKIGPSGSKSHITTRILGTYGYAAPEYVTTGHLYVKSDVYGFGVVLLEMLTGLRSMDTNRETGKYSLVEWIKPYLSSRRKLKDMMDTRLAGKYPSNSALQIGQLALNCIEHEPRNRPSMKEVLEKLEEIEAAKEKVRVPKKESQANKQLHRLR